MKGVLQEVESFAEKYLTSFSYEIRRKLNNKMLSSGELDLKYEIVTLSIDGTHNLIRKLLKNNFFPKFDENQNEFRSYKLKDDAYNVLVQITSFMVLIILVDWFAEWLVDLGRRSTRCFSQ